MSVVHQHEEQILVTYTLFPDVYPTEKTVREDVPWQDLTGRIKNAATYLAKKNCPLISMGEYGDTIDSDHKCLRYAENVQRVYGCELDYDGEKVSIDAAAKLLQDANLRSILYTSPSHTATKPRWRVLLPFSEPAIPEKRAEYLARANRILGGIASRESFTLSQSFYIGRVRGAPYEVYETNGRCIDMAAEIETQYYAGHHGNGADDSERDQTTDAELRAAFDRGEGRYEAMLKLSSRWAARGLSVDDIEATLLGMLGNGSFNADGVDLRTRARPMAKSAVRKYGETRRQKTGPDPRPEEQTPEIERPDDPIDLLAFDIHEILKPIAPERDLIPFMVPREAYMLIAGALSSFKTTLMMYIIILYATGRDLLQLNQTDIAVEIGPAVLIVYEDTLKRVLARFYRILQSGYGLIESKHGKTAANQFLADAAKNIRLIPFTGKFGKTIVVRMPGGLVCPNEPLLGALVAKVKGFASSDVLWAIDPLRLAIVGSQNDDDGADVAVTTLNRMSVAIPDSGLMLSSHTTKAGSQDPAEGHAGKALSTSGSSLYSNHARSNFLLSRIKPADIKKLFDADTVPPEEHAKQTIAVLSHGRLSHGPESTDLYMRMKGGLLLPVSPRKTNTVGDRLSEHLPAVVATMDKMREQDTKPSKNALEGDFMLRQLVGTRQEVRDLLALLEQNGYVEFTGKTTGADGNVTAKGRAKVGGSRRESPKEPPK